MNIEKVWELYANVNKWSEWDSDMQNVVLEGKFVTGTKGTMYIKEMPPLPFVLDEVQNGKVFINSSVLGEIVVQFGHFISEDGNGECTLKHTVTITGPNEAQLQGMGQGIVLNIPGNMERLSQLARM
ncbi:MAG: hypothetical protein FWH45_00345 [Methanomassiliicoccaceae archaeon]|nr:hypothetical protein [Methanomassiliicoccaceae archaeon]